MCECECVGLLARSRLKWPLIVFLHYLTVKKIYSGRHSSEDPLPPPTVQRNVNICLASYVKDIQF